MDRRRRSLRGPRKWLPGWAWEAGPEEAPSSVEAQQPAPQTRRAGSGELWHASHLRYSFESREFATAKGTESGLVYYAGTQPIERDLYVTWNVRARNNGRDDPTKWGSTKRASRAVSLTPRWRRSRTRSTPASRTFSAGNRRQQTRWRRAAYSARSPTDLCGGGTRRREPR